MAQGPVHDHEERLHVPLRWWLLGLLFVAALWLATAVSTPPWVAWTVTATAAVGIAAGLLRYGGTTVSVGADGIRAGPARLGWDACGDVQALDAAQTRRLRGVDADARAYLVLRPYVRESVRIVVADAADPTPYWLVSTRRPHDVVAAVAARRPAAVQD